MPAGHFLRWRSLGLPFRRKARCLNFTSQVFSVNFKKRVGSKRLKKRGDALVEHMHASHKSRNHGDTSVRNEPPLYCGLHAKTEDDDDDDEVYLMSSGDEDSSKGMKKWITEYHQNRPGLKVLQGKIDEFILAHEAQEEKARIEKEAQAAEGGWTVVVHHKGRKKTTDAESGVAVGSVAQVAVLDKMAKKKKKDLGIDFYGFQKREAKKNELMMLQSKFEQDKKRIQQLRAARKFRPY